MATIPLGDFAQARAVPRVDPKGVNMSPLAERGAGAAAIGDSLQRAGTILGNEAVAQQAKDTAEHEKAQAEADAITRARAANALSEYKLKVTAAELDEQDQLTRGADYLKAGERFETVVRNIPPPKIDGLAPDDQERLNGALANVLTESKLRVSGYANGARRDNGQVELQKTIAYSRQHASLPGADVDAENATLRAMGEQYVSKFGLDASIVNKAIEDTVEGNWSNQVTQRITAASTDYQALEAIAKDLEGKEGYYVSRMNPDTRVAMAATVRATQVRLQNAAKVEANQRENLAESAIKDAEEQIAAMIPPTPDTVGSWWIAVKGTSQEPRFKEVIQDIQEVQTVRRKSPAEQLQWVNDEDARLNANGGTPAEKRRLEAVRTALEKDRELAKSDPLQYYRNMTGKDVPALPLANLQGGDFTPLTQALAGRTSLITAMKKMGVDADMRILRSDEATTLVDVLNVAPTKSLVEKFYKPLRAAAGSEEAFLAIMDQIAPKSPLKAYAGNLAIRPGGDVAADLVLRGEALLSGTGDKAWKMPADKAFEDAFAREAGAAYQGNPDAYTRDFAAARAIYAAAAAKDGNTAAQIEFDDKRFASSMRAARGDIASVSGIKTIAPWGTDADDFEDQVPDQIRAALRNAGLDEDADGVGLIATSKPGRYVLTQGITPIYNPKTTRADGRMVPVYFDFKRPLPKAKGATAPVKQNSHVPGWHGGARGL